MDMKNRAKAHMMPVSEETEQTGQAVATVNPPEGDETWVEAYFSEITEHLTMIRSYQKTVQDQFIGVSKELEKSLAERKKIIEQANNIIENLRIETNKNLTEQTQTLKNYLATKEKDLTEALNEVKKFKAELLTGFMTLHTQNKVPIKYQLYKLGTISLGSILGGVIVFLVFRLLFPL